MKKLIRQLPSLLKETLKEWQDDNAMRLAAALAYYTVFSLVPLMLASIAVAGLVFGEEAATGKIYSEMHNVAGPQVASSVQEMVQAANKPESGLLGAVLGFAMGLFGASGVFGELMGSLNQIWGVTPTGEGGIMTWIKGRFLSIGMVMGVCFLLLVSLLLNTFLTTVTDYGLHWMPGVGFLSQAIAFILSFGLVTVLFAAMFKFLPKTAIQWRDVWVGGAVTALLFSIGKFGLEQYLARSNPTSGYGAAGALALILVWVYYSAQIFFFGAEFTEVYARRLGSRTAHAAPSEVKEHIMSGGAPAPDAKAVAAGEIPEPVLASTLAARQQQVPVPDPKPSALGQFAALAVAGFLTYRTEKKARKLEEESRRSTVD
ncbi:MAG: ribonuclease [Verrucomicrobiales bacterium]|nr:ribonuclease [Verrucomicrobiales bacterium]